MFTDRGATIWIKWSKTLRDRRQNRTIVVPSLGSSPICPVTLLRAMLQQFPGFNNDPLYHVPSHSLLTVLTDSMARKHL